MKFEKIYKRHKKIVNIFKLYNGSLLEQTPERIDRILFYYISLMRIEVDEFLIEVLKKEKSFNKVKEEYVDIMNYFMSIFIMLELELAEITRFYNNNLNENKDDENNEELFSYISFKDFYQSVISETDKSVILKDFANLSLRISNATQNLQYYRPYEKKKEDSLNKFIMELRKAFLVYIRMGKNILDYKEFKKEIIKKQNKIKSGKKFYTMKEIFK